jgi:hypothetical protein
MAINPSETLRVDTRGLPEGYDPHMFYEYRRDTLAQTATGIESFVYKYIPWNLVRSFCFAIDPTGPFKVAPHAITPYNRSRYRGVASVLQIRNLHTRVTNVSHDQAPNYNGISVCWSPVYKESITVVFDGDYALNRQPALIDYHDDTTSRTRLIGSQQGTMRMFKSYINSPPRTVRQKNERRFIFHPASGIPSPSCVAVGGTGNNAADATDFKSQVIAPTAAVLFPNSLTTLRDQEYAYLETLISKHVISMLKEWSPNKRSSTLFRNIVELRDIPRSISSLRETLKDLRSLYTSLSKSPSLQRIVFDLKNTSKDIPNEYLSYHFGWKQTYKDVMDALALPATISKKYEFLIKRAGKPTTFRVKRNFTSALSDNLPAFSYDNSDYEYGIVHTTRLERESELRLVINATFDFPPPNVVSFRSHSYLDRLGLVPRPTDLYNLTPWTWLVDWFTGLGSYVELIDNMARDDTLVNWGMITGKTTGRLITNHSSKVDNRLTITEDFVGSNTSISTDVISHDSILNYECSIRKDAAAALTVKTTAQPDLTGYQQSIIGALLAQRKGSFTPRS